MTRKLEQLVPANSELTLAYGPAAHSLKHCDHLLALALESSQRSKELQDIIELSCHWLYYLAGPVLAAPDVEEKKSRLAQLLQIDDWNLPSHEDEIWVGPRPEIISPWSSKAADILTSCQVTCAPGQVEALLAWRIQRPAWLDPSTVEWTALINDLGELLHDRMRQVLLTGTQDKTDYLQQRLDRYDGGYPIPPLRRIELAQLQTEVAAHPLLQSLDENLLLDLAERLQEAGRADVTAAELMMFAQVNSEHCRHWIFRSRWQRDGKPLKHSLFDLIRLTSSASDDPSKGQWKPGLVSCYSDNAAVFEGFGRHLLAPDENGLWRHHDCTLHLVAKAETHNHPTGISPWPGAATGVGGEIRDEAAAGRGGRSKMGVSGYMVSEPGWHRPPPHRLSPTGAPFAGPRQILVEAPLGAAAFANEFGRPNLAGFLRTLEIPAGEVQGADGQTELFGYDKPLMLAGGMGFLIDGQQHKAPVPTGAHLVVLGGPAMRIGIGGGSASSLVAGQGDADFDFASVQRDNAEMQRRCQQVLDACWQQKDQNPVLFIHDLGAGGLSNAVPELLHDCGRGGQLELSNFSPDRGRLLSEDGMTAEEIWCNESQERFLLAIAPDRLESFLKLCEREACPRFLLGQTTDGDRLVVNADDNLIDGDDRTPVDLPLAVLFDYDPDTARTLPSSTRTDTGTEPLQRPEDGLDRLDFQPVIWWAGALLSWPSIGSKAFLVQIADRSVGGLTARDQMVGPGQIPVADCAMTLASHLANDWTGEAVAMGEKAPLALLDPAASVRMAVAEALTNIAAAGISDPSQVRLSANWMADTGDEQADAQLYLAVEAFSEFCRQLDIAVPVGKDSLFMHSAAWQQKGDWVPLRKEAPSRVKSPLTLTVTAFAPVPDVRSQVTPALVPPAPADLEERLSGRRPTDPPETLLIHIDLGQGRRRLGGSCWQQVEAECIGRATPDSAVLVDDHPASIGGPTPDIESDSLRAFLGAVGQLVADGTLLAYHDISDGGLFACAFEMALAGGCGVRLYPAHTGWADGLFCEEAGALIQIGADEAPAVLAFLDEAGLDSRIVGHPIRDGRFELGPEPAQEANDIGMVSFAMGPDEDAPDYPWPLTKARDLARNGTFEHLTEAWTSHSDSVRLARGDDQVDEEAAACGTAKLRLAPSISADLWRTRPVLVKGSNKPPVAILREQGVNGHVEMAAAFLRAGMEARDLTMSDLVAGRARLEDFAGLAFCGGFSYGDTLGAGRGWAGRIAQVPRLKEQFQQFFARNDRFVLGICNGCQVLAALADIIPGAGHWPTFEHNLSGRYEARLVQVQIDRRAADTSPLLDGMGGQVLLVPVSHGEGRARFDGGPERLLQRPDAGIACRYAAAETLALEQDQQRDRVADLTAAQFHDDPFEVPQAPYPLNPNGSEDAVAGVYAANGRVLAMMPHPERVFRTAQLSWAPPQWQRDERGNWREDSPWMQVFRNAARF